MSYVSFSNLVHFSEEPIHFLKVNCMWQNPYSGWANFLSNLNFLNKHCGLLFFLATELMWRIVQICMSLFEHVYSSCTKGWRLAGIWRQTPTDACWLDKIAWYRDYIARSSIIIKIWVRWSPFHFFQLNNKDLYPCLCSICIQISRL